MQKAAFFDVDGTLTDIRVWEGILEYFQKRGLRKWTHRIYWSYHFPIYLLRKLGLISEGSFRKPWAAHLAWYFRGFSPSETEDIWTWVSHEFLANHWRTDILNLLNQHKQSNDLVMLVSAGPEPLIMYIAHEIGADFGIGTELEIKETKFTGRSIKPVCINEYKAQKVKITLQKHGLAIELADSFAYADSISDQQLLELAGHPVAVYPDEALRKLAIQNSWQILPN